MQNIIQPCAVKMLSNNTYTVEAIFVAEELHDSCANDRPMCYVCVIHTYDGPLQAVNQISVVQPLSHSCYIICSALDSQATDCAYKATYSSQRTKLQAQ